MRWSRWRPRRCAAAARPILLMAGLSGAGTLAGCAAAGGAADEMAGFAAGSAAGALTGNPFVAVGIGMATRFASGEARAYIDRRKQAAIRAAIAEAAGNAEEGEIVPWRVDLDIPPGHAHGQAQSVRVLDGQIQCREVLYSVKNEDAAYYVGVICRHPDGWRWAIAEPTAERWRPSR